VAECTDSELLKACLLIIKLTVKLQNLKENFILTVDTEFKGDTVKKI
jgi:hypothetical protein